MKADKGDVMFSLAGRVALITGAASGIGAATAPYASRLSQTAPISRRSNDLDSAGSVPASPGVIALPNLSRRACDVFAPGLVPGV